MSNPVANPFPSAKAFFDHAAMNGAEQNGYYVVHGRPVRFYLQAATISTPTVAYLQRLDWQDLSLFRRFCSAVARILFGNDLCAEEPAGVGKRFKLLPAASDEAATEARIERELQAVKLLSIAGPCSEQVAARWISEVLSSLFTAKNSDLSRNRSPLEQKLDALQDQLAAETDARIAVTRTPLESCLGTPTLVHLHIDVGVAPTFGDAPSLNNQILPRFKEAAIGPINGSAELLLHALLQLRLFKIHGPEEDSLLHTAWSGKKEITADKFVKINDAEFRECIGKALENCEARARDRVLILTGGILGETIEHSHKILSVLELMHDRGMQFEITYSDQDRDMLRKHLEDKRCTSKDSASENNRDESRETARLMDKVYLPHLKLVSLSGSGKTLYSDVAGNRNIVDILQRRIGYRSDSVLNHKVCKQINANFQHAIWANDSQKFFALTDVRQSDFWKYSIHQLGEATPPLAPQEDDDSLCNALPDLSRFDKPHGITNVVGPSELKLRRRLEPVLNEFEFLRSIRKRALRVMNPALKDLASTRLSETLNGLCIDILVHVGNSEPNVSPSLEPLVRHAVLALLANAVKPIDATELSDWDQVWRQLSAVLPAETVRKLLVCLGDLSPFHEEYGTLNETAKAAWPHAETRMKVIDRRLRTLEEKHRQTVDSLRADGMQRSAKEQQEYHERRDELTAEIAKRRVAFDAARKEDADKLADQLKEQLSEWETSHSARKTGLETKIVMLKSTFEAPNGRGKTQSNNIKNRLKKVTIDLKKLNCELDAGCHRIESEHRKKVVAATEACGLLRDRLEQEWASDKARVLKRLNEDLELRRLPHKLEEIATAQRYDQQVATLKAERKAVVLDANSKTTELHEMLRGVAVATLNEVRQTLGGYVAQGIAQQMIPPIANTEARKTAPETPKLDRASGLYEDEIVRALNELMTGYEKSFFQPQEVAHPKAPHLFPADAKDAGAAIVADGRAHLKIYLH